MKHPLRILAAGLIALPFITGGPAGALAADEDKAPAQTTEQKEAPKEPAKKDSEAKKAGKETSSGAKEAGRDVANAFKKFGRDVGDFFEGLFD